MHITFRQMRLFLALADTGSVGGAARALHVSQPTASMQLKEISNAVGLPLYEVIARRVRLTDVGQDLARSVRRIHDEWAAFEQIVAKTQGFQRGKLRLAVVSTAEYFVPRLLGSFCAKYPEIDIALEVLNRDGVVQRLRDTRDDLYIMSMPPADMDLADQVIMANPLVAIAASTHPLAKRTRLALPDLQDQAFILRELGSGTRMAVDAFFKTQQFKPKLRFELGSNEAIKEAVAGNLGIAVVSRHALYANSIDPAVTVLKVKGFPINSQWHLVHPKNRQLSPVAQVFQAHLVSESKQWFKQHL